MDAVLKIVLSEQEERIKWQNSFASTLKKAIDEAALENGHITKNKMLEILNSHYDGLKQTLNDDFDKLVKKYFGDDKQTKNMNSDEDIVTFPHMKTQDGYCVYTHSGKLGQHVCEGWNFPDAFLKQAWRCWLIGQSEYQQTLKNGKKMLAPIRPFRLLKRMPAKLKRFYLVSWAPMLKLMESAPGIEIPQDLSTITSEFINSSFIIGEKYVLETVEYLKDKRKKSMED